MGLFDAVKDLASMPLRLGVDIVKLPGKIVNGEDDLLHNTSRGIDKIEDDLEED